jgi:hypothetical protein
MARFQEVAAAGVTGVRQYALNAMNKATLRSPHRLSRLCPSCLRSFRVLRVNLRSRYDGELLRDFFGNHLEESMKN